MRRFEIGCDELSFMASKIGMGITFVSEERKAYRMSIQKAFFLFCISILSLLPGCGTPKTTPTSEALARISEAEKGDANAQYGLALDYKYGFQGLPKSQKKYIEYLQLAAQQGHLPARVALSHNYLRGDGVPKDYAKAAFYLLEYAQHKTLSGIDCYRLGEMYEHGDGVQKDLEEAFKWYVRAYDAGYDVTKDDKIDKLIKEYGFDINQYLLFGLFLEGWAYEHGEGVEKDMEKALSLYREAAQKKVERAQERLGYLYMTGTGVSKDYYEAAKWYKMAAMERIYCGDRLLVVGYSGRDKAYNIAEDYCLAPELKQKILLGSILGIANKKGEYDIQEVQGYQNRIKSGNAVMSSEPDNILNMQRCVRMAGIPRSCAGEIIQKSGTPVLGDIDCVECSPSPDIDYTSTNELDASYGNQPYR